MSVIAAERGFVETEHLKSWVYASCGTVIGAYFCATCGQSFPTRAHMKGHIEGSPDVQHVVVFDCPKHGFEVPPKSAKECETA